MKSKIVNFYKKRKRLYTWKKLEVSKLRQFKDIHKGQDCFIIGNGPSLNKMDLTLLNDYHTFGLNKIYLIFKRVNLDLSYLVSVNKFVIDQSIDVFKKMSIPIFLNNKCKEEISYQSDNLHFLETGNQSITGDITKPIYEGGTVTVVALQLAFYMGFKNVFLVGVDHNFQQKGSPNEIQKMKNDDPNHFDPNYFKGQKWQLADLDKSEESYFKCRKLYESNYRKVIDATVDGKLKIFDKMLFQDALAKAKKKSV